MNKGTPAEKNEVITVGATKGETSTYLTHKFDGENTTDDYWEWATGGKTTYMPTFNKNKDSLKADINGTFAENYEDYVDYTETTEVTADATYDNDSNSVEDGGVTTVEETHYAKDTAESKDLISMAEWLELNEGEYSEATHANYWVYDTDGWCYWSSPIKADTATGLLLDGISLKEVMDDSYYYAINVVGQFVTADDLGKDDNTGFYADATQAPSEDAIALLKEIGVDTGEVADDDENEPTVNIPEGDSVYKMHTERSDGNYDMTFFTTVDNLNSEQASAIAEDLGLGKVVVYCRAYSYDNDNALKKTVSVSFANPVKGGDMRRWFSYIGNETSEAVQFDWTNLDTSEATRMDAMFYSSTNIIELDLSSFDTSNVTKMNEMFSYCANLKRLNLSSFDTSKVTDFHSMFRGCTALESLDVSKFNTSSATSMSSMFAYLSKVEELDVSNFDTSSVTSLSGLFYNCNLLESLDLSSFDTANVTDIMNMFTKCSSLKTLTVGSKWNTANVTDMRLTFEDCENLTFDCSGWNVDKVTSDNKRDFNKNAPGVIAPNWISE